MLLSIIIVSYNTKDLLKQCLDSIIKSLTDHSLIDNKHQTSSKRVTARDQASSFSYEIIIVDNNSKDDTQEMIKQLMADNRKKKNKPSSINHHPLTIKLIENQQNLGFAKANNQGIKIAQGEYILLLNSDTKIIQKDFFARAIRFLEKHPKIGILGPKLLWPGNKLQPSGGYFPQLPRLFAWAFFLDDLPFLSSLIRSYHPHHPGFYTKSKYFDQPHFQDWVTGACFFVRRSVFDKVGLLDENFFMYAEEMEFCFRAKKAGFKVFYYPKLFLLHYGGQSSRPGTALRGEFVSLKYFFRKHFPSYYFYLALFLLKMAAFLRIILFFIVNQKEKSKIYKEILLKI